MWKHKEVVFPPSWHLFVVILVFTSTWYVHSSLIRYESIDMFACPHVPGHLSHVTCPCHMPAGGLAPAPVLAWWQCRGCKKYKCQGGCGWPGQPPSSGIPSHRCRGHSKVERSLQQRVEAGGRTRYRLWLVVVYWHCTVYWTRHYPASALATTLPHSCHFRQKRTTDLKGQIRAYFSWKIGLFSWKLKLLQLEFTDFFRTKRITAILMYKCIHD